LASFQRFWNDFVVVLTWERSFIIEQESKLEGTNFWNKASNKSKDDVFGALRKELYASLICD
jgi:hypothetical protein